MTNTEAIAELRNMQKFNYTLAPNEVFDMAISALEKQEGKKPITVETNIYDTEEIHHGCIVQILRNSVTGDVSVGWWRESEEDDNV